MSTLKNIARLLTGKHRALVMDVQEVHNRVAALTVARHKFCELASLGDTDRYNRAFAEWMLGELGQELMGLHYWLDRTHGQR